VVEFFLTGQTRSDLIWPFFFASRSRNDRPDPDQPDPVWPFKKNAASVLVSVVTYCITAGAGHSSSVQVSDRILWSAAWLCTHGRYRVSVLASDQRYLRDCQLLHGPQTARELRMLSRFASYIWYLNHWCYTFSEIAFRAEIQSFCAPIVSFGSGKNSLSKFAFNRCPKHATGTGSMLKPAMAKSDKHVELTIQYTRFNVHLKFDWRQRSWTDDVEK